MQESIPRLFDLTGRIAVVTGGTGAIGSALVRGLAGAGATVVVLARNAERVDRLAESVVATGGTALGVAADVLDKDRLLDVRSQVIDRYGRIDMLINGAGGNVAAATLQPGERVFELDEAALREVFDLNLFGTILPTQVFGEAMAEQGSGSVVNVSSMAADRTITRVVGYSAAKASIENFTRWIAVEFARSFGDGLRVNAIAPGFFIGDQNRDLLLNPDGSLTERGRTIVDLTPMARFGEVDELVGTVLWLCSDASRFVTGVVVPVDGGFSAFSGV